jgi:adenosylcobinamide-GDP ribazoletransferase
LSLLTRISHAFRRLVAGRRQDPGSPPSKGAAEPLAAATEYLTPIPAVWTAEYAPEDVARGLVWFPVVGLGIGLLAGAAVFLAGFLVPNLALGAIAVAVLAKATGGQGSIGLAAFSDRFLRGRLREKVRQPLAGGEGGFTAGAVLACSALVAKAVMLGGLGHWECTRAVILVAVAGRAAMVLGTLLAGCTDGEDSIDRVVWNGRGQEAVIAALVCWGLVAALLLFANGVVAFVGAAVYAAIFAMYSQNRFGGLDGRGLFALGEASELLTCLLLSALLGS